MKELSEKDYQRAKKGIAWLPNLSAVEDYEKQLKSWGYEGNERLLALINERKAQLGAQEEADAARRASYVYYLEKLDVCKAVPRSDASDFFKDCAGRPPLFGKEKWKAKYAHAPIVYCAVVQANNALWEPGKRCWLWRWTTNIGTILRIYKRWQVKLIRFKITPMFPMIAEK